ncbi:glucan 1,3-beta-glucosidase [Xylogone sp. PMI_703]|nr:glucan 1,3-beta-glucosidase [Xylogone sp. PMI_703]
MSSIILLVATFLVSTIAKPLAPRQNSTFNYNTQKVRGVNLGGWFVLEPWITPSLFQPWANGGGVVDEYTYSQALGRSATQYQLNQHWGHWITQEDFQEIAHIGLNHVRIPIGYWAVNPLPGDPYVQGQLQVLDKAIGWARTAGLKIMLDIHGVPGSQNGFDNSGRAGPIQWQSDDTVSQTQNALNILAKRYSGDSDVVTSIELVNEPANWGLNMDLVKQYYVNGYNTVRSDAGATGVVIHDAFEDVQYWNGFMNQASGYSNVILDTHIYQVFSNAEVAMSPCNHIATACASGPKIAGTDKDTVVGEWSGAQTDCAKWLNGLGKGARYDGTFPGSTTVGSCDGKYAGTVQSLSDVDKMNLEYYIEAQLDAYEEHSGWIFWTWKTESAPEWHFQNLTRAGIVPQPLTSRRHPGQCNSGCQIPS